MSMRRAGTAEPFRWVRGRAIAYEQGGHCGVDSVCVREGPAGSAKLTVCRLQACTRDRTPFNPGRGEWTASAGALPGGDCDVCKEAEARRAARPRVMPCRCKTSQRKEGGLRHSQVYDSEP